MRVKLEQQYFPDEELTTKAHITPFNADFFPIFCYMFISNLFIHSGVSLPLP